MRRAKSRLWTALSRVCRSRKAVAGPSLTITSAMGRQRYSRRWRSWKAKSLDNVFQDIPTSSSWLNQVERWFGELTQKAVRRGAFISIAELQEAIEQFLQAWNEAARPFVWTATVEKIMEKVERARQKLEEIKPGWSARKKRKKRRKYV